MKIVKVSLMNTRKIKSGFLLLFFLVSILVVPLVARADATEPIGAAMRSITTLLFIAAFTVVAAITLLAIAIMLIIRYIYLTILLILSPIVWLLWIFPSTAGHWKKWWSEFIRWSMFAPLVLFFIYLTITVITKYPNYWEQYSKNINAVENQGFAIDFAYIANLVAVVGLLMGGLFTANKMGIVFASTAYGWASGAGKMFGGWVGKKGVQFGTRPLRGKRGSDFIAGVEAWGSKSKSPLLRTITRPVRVAGTALNRIRRTGAEDLVADAKKRLQGYDLKKLGEMLPALNEYEQVAALEMLKTPKSLDLPADITQFITKGMENTYVKSGQAKPDFSNVMRTVGFNYDMLPLIRQIAELEESGKAVPSELRAQLDEASLEFEKGHRPAHYTQFQADEFFKRMIDPKTGKIAKKGEFGLTGQEQLLAQRTRIKSIMEGNPDGFLNVFRGTKGAQRDNFVELLVEFIDKERGSMSRGQWLKSQPKYKPLVTVLNSPAARSLGLGLEEIDGGAQGTKESETQEQRRRREERENQGYL